jgi:single-stranded DNA-binding protein
MQEHGRTALRLNIVIVSGNVVQDAAVFTGVGGRLYALFTLAVDATDPHQKTAYVDCCLYTDVERQRHRLTRGAALVVKGKISTRLVETTDGKRRNTMRLLVTDMIPCASVHDETHTLREELGKELAAIVNEQGL